jgi:hypothetical protein
MIVTGCIIAGDRRHASSDSFQTERKSFGKMQYPVARVGLPVRRHESVWKLGNAAPPRTLPADGGDRHEGTKIYFKD